MSRWTWLILSDKRRSGTNSGSCAEHSEYLPGSSEVQGDLQCQNCRAGASPQRGGHPERCRQGGRSRFHTLIMVIRYDLSVSVFESKETLTLDDDEWSSVSRNIESHCLLLKTEVSHLVVCLRFTGWSKSQKSHRDLQVIRGEICHSQVWVWTEDGRNCTGIINQISFCVFSSKMFPQTQPVVCLCAVNTLLCNLPDQCASALHSFPCIISRFCFFLSSVTESFCRALIGSITGAD